MNPIETVFISRSLTTSYQFFPTNPDLRADYASPLRRNFTQAGNFAAGFSIVSASSQRFLVLVSSVSHPEAVFISQSDNCSTFFANVQQYPCVLDGYNLSAIMIRFFLVKICATTTR